MPPLLRGLPRAVWAASAFFWATLVFWSVTIPMFRGPDEADHVSAVLYWAENHDWPGYQEMPLLASVLEARAVSGFRWHTEPPVIRPSLTAADADDVRVQVPFSELAEGGSVWWNKSSQHPPLYYQIVGLVRPATDGLPWDGEVWFFRLVSILLVCPLPLLAAALARRLGAGRPVVIASALAVCSIPQLGVVGGTVNNDNLLIGAGGWLALGTVVVATGDLRKRTAVWVGITAVVALLAKAWALPLVLVAVFAYAVAGTRLRRLRQAVVSCGVFCGVSLVGGWWWIRNLMVYGTLQPSGHTAPLAEPLPLGEALGRVSERFFGFFPERFWALLSTKAGEHAYPRWIPTLLVLVLVALIVAAFVRSSRIGVGRPILTVMAAPTALILVVMVVEATRFAVTTGVPSGIQGRYLYGTIAFIVVLTVLGLSTLVRRVERLPVVIAAFAVAFTFVSFARAVSYHYGDDRWSDPVGSFPDLLGWSPVPALVVAAIVAAVVGGAGWVLWEAIADGCHRQGAHVAGQIRPQPPDL